METLDLGTTPFSVRMDMMCHLHKWTQPKKNKISHRGKAIKQLVKFLEKNKVQLFDIHNKNRILNENKTNK